MRCFVRCGTRSPKAAWARTNLINWQRQRGPTFSPVRDERAEDDQKCSRHDCVRPECPSRFARIMALTIYPRVPMIGVGRQEVELEDGRPLPSYRRPPVSEVALSVEFSPLSEWSIVHFGIFWAAMRNRFPKYEFYAPLRSQIEEFGDARFNKPEFVQLMTGIPELRSWFLNDQGEIVQVQRDRFVFNWRKNTDESEYPRYREYMRPRFEEEWARFSTFIGSHGLGEISVRQCEITYINEIIPGDLWQTNGDMQNIFTTCRRSQGAFLPQPESAVSSFTFVMPGERGRLHTAVQHVLRSRDNQQIIQFRLTARGKPEGSRPNDIFEWMDLGREWVVRGFTDLTTEAAHRAWERTQ